MSQELVVLQVVKQLNKRHSSDGCVFSVFLKVLGILSRDRFVIRVTVVETQIFKNGEA